MDEAEAREIYNFLRFEHIDPNERPATLAFCRMLGEFLDGNSGTDHGGSSAPTGSVDRPEGVPEAPVAGQGIEALAKAVENIRKTLEARGII